MRDAVVMHSIGRNIWAIPEGYIPDHSMGPAPEMTSHETACILNCNREAARVEITIYFSDRPPLGPFIVDIAGERTLHLRFNELGEGAIPRGVDYASVLRANIPIVVQHTRLDSRQAQNALLSTIAYAA